jgi:succinate dehydrogenase hydrophobic anchor subunit
MRVANDAQAGDGFGRLWRRERVELAAGAIIAIAVGGRLSPFYLVAVVLALFAAAAHSWLGEKLILGPLLKTDPLPSTLKPAINRRLVRAVWHLPSAIWAAIGIYVLWAMLAQSLNGETAIMLGAIFAVSGVANLAAVRRIHFAWATLFAIAAALWIGAAL